MLLKYFVPLTIFRKNFGSVLRCSSQWQCLCIFYQVKELISCKYFGIYKDFGKHPRKLLAWNPLLLKLQSSNVFPAIDFWKHVEVLVQHLKNLFWKIMSYHIMQRISIILRFCKLSSLYFFVFCVLHKPKS